MSAVLGTHAVVYALQQHGQDVQAGVADELARLAQEAVRTMRRLAPKGVTSALVNSIQADADGPLAWNIGPHVDYAARVEDGVKPGGKGLPRFFDPRSRSIVEWLMRHAPKAPAAAKVAKGLGGRKGSRVFTAAMRALRDRYEGLAWHVRQHGIAAQPFVGPTLTQMEPVVLARLDLAVRRVLALRPDDTGGALA